MSEKTTGTVVFELDQDHRRRLSDAEADRLRNLKDEDIDFTDAPRSGDSVSWQRRYPGGMRKAS